MSATNGKQGRKPLTDAQILGLNLADAHLLKVLERDRKTCSIRERGFNLAWEAKLTARIAARGKNPKQGEDFSSIFLSKETIESAASVETK